MKRVQSVRPALEVLEDRRVPALVLQLDAAGNLSVTGQQTGNLTVTETAANTLQVQDGASNLGSYAVTGNLTVLLGNTATAFTDTLAFGGNEFHGSVRLSAGSGAGTTSVLVTGPGPIDGSLTVNTAGSANFVNMDGTNVRGSVYVSNGAGSDVVFAGVGSTVGGSFTVVNSSRFATDMPFTVGGNLVIDSTRAALPTSVAVGVNLGGNLVVNTSPGNAAVRFNESSVLHGSALIHLGNGSNTVSLAPVAVLGNLTVVGGSGGNTVTFGGAGAATVGGNLTMIMGNGVNTVNFNAGAAVNGGTIQYVGGNGVDTLNFNALAAPGARLTAFMGNGNDVVNFNATTSTLASAYLDGGLGTNTFNPTGTIAFPITLVNF